MTLKINWNLLTYITHLNYLSCFSISIAFVNLEIKPGNKEEPIAKLHLTKLILKLEIRSVNSSVVLFCRSIFDTNFCLVIWRYSFTGLIGINHVMSELTRVKGMSESSKWNQLWRCVIYNFICRKLRFDCFSSQDFYY